MECLHWVNIVNEESAHNFRFLNFFQMSGLLSIPFVVWKMRWVTVETNDSWLTIRNVQQNRFHTVRDVLGTFVQTETEDLFLSQQQTGPENLIVWEERNFWFFCQAAKSSSELEVPDNKKVLKKPNYGLESERSGFLWGKEQQGCLMDPSDRFITANRALMFPGNLFLPYQSDSSSLLWGLKICARFVWLKVQQTKAEFLWISHNLPYDFPNMTQIESLSVHSLLN